jgi:DNA-binding beta-propeller fold protein YncE
MSNSPQAQPQRAGTGPCPGPGLRTRIGAGGVAGRTRARARARLALLLTLGAALLVLSIAAPALGARGHEFAGAFGWGVVNGKTELQRCKSEAPPAAPVCQPGLAGNGEGQLDSPSGIAVNEATGNVYVVDRANDRVEIFNASGSKFEGEFNGSGLLPNEGKAAGSGGQPEEVATGAFDEPEGIAVDNDASSPSFGDVYVADAGRREETKTSHPVIDKFSSSGKYIGQITRNPNGEAFAESGFRAVFGVAVDGQGEVWVEEQNFGSSPGGAAHYTNAVQNAWLGFTSTRNERSSVPAPGLAVDTEGALYVHNTFDVLSGNQDALAKFSGSGELITAKVDEEPPTGVAVELTSDDVYISHAANVHRVGESGASLETLESPGTGRFSGVAVNSATLTVYVADAQASRVDIFSPEAPGVPRVVVGSESITEVSASSVSFAAEVNPRSEAGEEATSYAFRYGPCESPSSCVSSPYPQSIPVPEGSLPANYEPDQLSAHPQDLLAHTVYHMLLVAQNSHGEGRGEELVFTTQSGGGALALADGRRWELVSPIDKHGALILPIEGSGVIQAAADGSAISYLANAPSEAQPQGFSQTVQVLSRRGSSAWESQDIATPHEAPAGVSLGPGQGEYHFFSEDLSSAIVQPVGPFTRAISPQASEGTAFLRRNFAVGDPADPCGSFCYRPLVSGCPEAGEPCPGAVEEVANVPAGTKFAEEGVKCRGGCGPSFLGASADASHVVLVSAEAALIAGAPRGSLYEWSAGKLALVSVLPGGQAVGTSAKAALGYQIEQGDIRIERNAISANGERVIFSEAGGAHHLYLRDTARGEGGETIELDSPEAACTGKCKGEARPVFQTASADGSRVFFTDSQPLTQASGNSDLYECEIEEREEEQLACKLSDLTPPGAGEEGAGVLGLIAGAAEDGSAVYFTANGKLSEGPSARGEEAVAGDCAGNTVQGSVESEIVAQRCNLYVRSGGRTRLVAVLSGADFPDWSLRQGAGLRTLTARVSESGRYLAFMSRRSLSGYDNRDAVSGKADQEVFLYDSGASGGAGGLVCASCDPSGARPRGVQYKQITSDNARLAGGSSVWPAEAWIAANIPGWTAISEAEGFALHQSRYLSDSGRLFFNAADALVAQDTNKTEDVYEHEPAGVGDCSEAKSSFDPASGGCVSLISGGVSSEESAFLDASESGDDVFFLTAQRLLPGQDVDQSIDVYDAHACSASSPCLPEPAIPPPACEGDACQSPGTPPEDPTPASLTFQGPGNPVPPIAAIVKPAGRAKTVAQLNAERLKRALKTCKVRRSKRKRSVCEAKARRQLGPVRKAKKSTRRSMV